MMEAPKHTVSKAVLGAFVALLVWGTAPGRARADANEVNGTLLLKTLSYDKNLGARFDGRVVIGILYPIGQTGYLATLRTFQTLAQKTTIQGSAPKVVAVPFVDAVDLRAALARLGVTALFVTPEVSSQIANVTAVAHASRIPTLSFSRADALRGAAIAIAEKDGRPAIVVNLTSCRLVGMSLSAQLLRLAEVIK